jgi:hypothetical protein
MAVNVIETKAIISAADQTGATFSAVALKLRNMENAAKSAQKGLAAATRMGESARHIRQGQRGGRGRAFELGPLNIRNGSRRGAG